MFDHLNWDDLTWHAGYAEKSGLLKCAVYKNCTLINAHFLNFVPIFWENKQQIQRPDKDALPFSWLY